MIALMLVLVRNAVKRMTTLGEAAAVMTVVVTVLAVMSVVTSEVMVRAVMFGVRAVMSMVTMMTVVTAVRSVMAVVPAEWPMMTVVPAVRSVMSKTRSMMEVRAFRQTAVRWAVMEARTVMETRSMMEPRSAGHSMMTVVSRRAVTMASVWSRTHFVTSRSVEVVAFIRRRLTLLVTPVVMRHA